MERTRFLNHDSEAILKLGGGALLGVLVYNADNLDGFERIGLSGVAAGTVLSGIHHVAKAVEDYRGRKTQEQIENRF